MARFTTITSRLVCLVLAALACGAAARRSLQASTDLAQIDPTDPSTWPHDLMAFLQWVANMQPHSYESYESDKYDSYGPRRGGYRAKNAAHDRYYKQYQNGPSHYEQQAPHYKHKRSSTSYDEERFYDILPAEGQAKAQARAEADAPERANLANAAAGFDYTRHGGKKPTPPSRKWGGSGGKYRGDDDEYWGEDSYGYDEYAGSYKDDPKAYKAYAKEQKKAKKEGIDVDMTHKIVMTNITGPPGPPGPPGPAGHAGKDGETKVSYGYTVVKAASCGVKDTNVFNLKLASNIDCSPVAETMLKGTPSGTEAYKISCTHLNQYQYERRDNKTGQHYITMMCQAACLPGYTLGAFSAGGNPYRFDDKYSSAPRITELTISPHTLDDDDDVVPARVIYIEVPLPDTKPTLCALYPPPKYVASVSIQCCPDEHYGSGEYYRRRR